MSDLPLKYRPYYKQLRTSHKHMKYRCYNASSPKYYRYGGRGIKVCARWLVFENFYNDMVSTYKIGLTLNRINNNGDYEPNNCEWASAKEQANNRQTNTLITYQGITKTIAQWADFADLKQTTLIMRINKGWSMEKCLKPVGSF